MAARSVGNNATGSFIEVWDYSSLPEIVIPTLPNGKKPDHQAEACYELTQVVDTFFFNKFSFGEWNTDKTMRACVHYKRDIGEDGLPVPAVWNGEAVLLGDVDPQFFNHPPACDLDIVAHEFGHAVTQSRGRLGNKNQSGALKESISDIFAISIKHDCRGISADNPDANWFLSDGFLNRANGTALRSFSHPGTAFKGHPILRDDHQVAHFADYQPNTSSHRNSGIPNHAFFLAASKIGGPTWETAEIWYEALQHTNGDDFATFAGRTLQATKDLGRKEPIYNIVANAWRDVGVDLRRVQREEGKERTNPYLKPLDQVCREKSRDFVSGMIVLGIAYTLYKAVSWLNKK